MAKSKVIQKRVYSITANTLDDGSVNFIRNNDGFSVIELIGILEVVKSDLLKVLSSQIVRENDTTKRKAKNTKII